jgi:hypothetical protein
MSKGNKLGVDFGDMSDTTPAPTPAKAPPRNFERNEKRGPGRPIGKRSNPAFRQYTILIRSETHSRALDKLRKITAKPDFGEYVEALILKDLAKS